MSKNSCHAHICTSGKLEDMFFCYFLTILHRFLKAQGFLLVTRGFSEICAPKKGLDFQSIKEIWNQSICFFFLNDRRSKTHILLHHSRHIALPFDGLQEVHWTKSPYSASPWAMSGSFSQDPVHGISWYRMPCKQRLQGINQVSLEPVCSAHLEPT